MSDTDNLPYLHIAEAIIQEPLTPSDGNLSSNAYFEDEPRVDIRTFAYQVAIDAAQKVLADRLAADTALTKLDITAIRKEMGPHFSVLSRQVAMANNIAKVNFRPQLPTISAGHHARAAFQGSMLEVFQVHAQTLPLRNVQAHDHSITDQLRDGLLGVAPTGSGKTVIAAKSLQALGIGEPAGIDGRPLRALVVLPSQNLIDQFSGAKGDDTFRRFLGHDIPLSSYWEEEKDLSGSVVLTTRHSLPKAIESGMIAPDSFDIAVFDEAHHGLGPTMKAHLGQLGIRLFCLTATPAYNTQRDLRQLFSHVEIGSLYSFVREGILNPARLYTYRSHDNEVEIAAGLASTYIKEGRKVVVYCRPGEKSAEAKQVAELINKQTDSPTAKAIGSFKPKGSEEYLQKFHTGDVRCLTTVAMLGEGWNADVDVVIIIGSNGSLLDLTQKVGRAMRPGELDTIIAEILPPPASDRQLYSIWNVFGLEEVVQGLRLGTDTNSLVPTDTQPAGSSGGSSHGSKEFPDEMQKFPKIVREALVPGQPLREIIIAPENLARRDPPEGYFEIDQLAAEHNVPVKWLQMKLDEADISYVGIWRDGKKSQFERWYDPSAVAYLQENPVPKMANETTFHQQDIVKLTGLSADGIRAIITRLELEGEKRLGKQNRITTYYSLEQLTAILEEVNSTPPAHESDVVFNEILTQLGHSFVRRWCADNDIIPIDKRRHPAHGIKGVARHITQEQAIQITEARISIPVANEDTIGIAEIARLAGVHDITVRKSLTPEEEAQLCFMRQVGARTHLAEHLPRTFGEDVVSRLRPRPLPPHLAPLVLIQKRTGKTKAEIATWMARNNFSKLTLRIAGVANAVSCYSWEAVGAAERHFGCADGYSPLNPAMLVHADDEADYKKWEYVQMLQSAYLDRKFLPLPPAPPAIPPTVETKTTEEELSPQEAAPLSPLHELLSLRELLAQLNCTPAAMHWIFLQASVTDKLYAVDGSAKKTHITLAAAQEVRDYCQQNIAVVLSSSLSFTRLAAATGVSSMELFALIEHRRTPSDSVRIRRAGLDTQIDLYCNDSLVRRIIEEIRIKRRKT